MFSFGRNRIKVTFRDQASQTVVSSVRMPAERIPETFGAGSELKMAGGHYIVVSSKPATKGEAVDSGHLEVIVRKHVASVA
jgi:hypothetical protein